MNIVVCDKKCIYQKDGYCTATGTMQVKNTTVGECPFYDNSSKDVNMSNQKLFSDKRKSLFNI